MRFIYDLLSGCLVVMSTTGLLTERIKGWQYIALTMYVMAMAELSKITGLGQVIGLVMVPVLFVLLAFCIKNKRIWNLCLGCVGYLISIALNNLVLYMVSKFGKISVYTISEKYWLLFSIGYIAFIAMLIFFIRRCLIDKKKESIEKMTQTMTIGLFTNLMLFLLIFIINISMVERIGYSIRGIRFNIILFAICLLISSILFIACIMTVKKEEEQKAYLSEIIHTTEKISEGQDLAWKELKYVYPLELKGFLYEKILSAYAQKIQMYLQIDEKLDLQCSYMKDVIRILGIFIDNAIEETRDMENGYIIIVAMNTEQGCFFSVTNNYKNKPELALIQQRGYTTKGENRGMGLYWADELVKKHEIMHNTNITDTEIAQEIEIMKE